MTTPDRPRVLVTFGSKRGGTAEIATRIADALRVREFTVDCAAASRVRDLDDYDAVIVGGALYMAHWHRDARRFVKRHASALRRCAVWMFSSGPLDTTATHAVVPAVSQVASLMARVGARGHATFGGRLTPNAEGFIASQMAKTRAGDWRDWTKVDEWAHEVANVLEASPHPVASPADVALPVRWLLATLCLTVGIAAMSGGAALVARPDGSLLHMPLPYLAHTPFTSFLIPGLLLFLVVGVGHALAGALVLRKTATANVVAFGAGTALVTWIVSEMILLREINGLQVAFLATGLVIMVEALRRYARTHPSHRAIATTSKSR